MIRTIEDNFDYQAHEIFKDMVFDYETEQNHRKITGFETETFSEYIWRNQKELGRLFYERFDEYVGIDEETKKYNLTPVSTL